MLSPDSPVNSLAASTANEICVAQGWALEEVLRVHERKRMVTALVRVVAEKKAILKAALPDACQDALVGLQKERDFFSDGGFDLAPGFVIGGDHFYCREFEPGQTVRRWMTESPARAAEQLPTAAIQLVQGFSRLRMPATEGSQSVLAARCALGRVRNLALSGPRGTVRSASSEKVSKLVVRLMTPVIFRTVARVVACWHESGVQYVSTVGHNDLHCDNVLITSSGEPRVIDFENISQPGFWWIDVLYFAGTCYAALESDSARSRFYEAVVGALVEAEPGFSREMPRLASLFCAAGLANSRFRAGRLGTLGDVGSMLSAVRALAGV